MVYSSLQLKASVAYLILRFMEFECLSIPVYTNSTNSKWTPTNGTISADYHQSVSYNVNEHISTMKTSHGALAKLQSYVNKSQNDVTLLKDEETSLKNSVNNSLAANNTHNSRRFSRSERSTRSSMLVERRSSEIQKWINYVANCINNSSAKCHDSCSLNSTERNKYLKISGTHWDNWNVKAASPMTISTNRSYVTAVCTNAGHAKCHCSNHSAFYDCHQVYYCHQDCRSHHHPVGCVCASSKSKEIRPQSTPDTTHK